MKKTILLFLLILMIPIVLAGNYGAGTYGNGVYGVGEVISGTTTGGGGGFASGAQAGTVQLASEVTFMSQEVCEQSAGFDWYINTCYECEGDIIERGNELVCIKCNEGFVLIGDECKAEKTERELSPFILDKLINKSFPDNPILGVILIFGVVTVGIISYQKRVTFNRNIKKFLNKEI